MAVSDWELFKRRYSPKKVTFDDGYYPTEYRYNTREVSPEESKEIQDAIEYIRSRGGDFKNFDSRYGQSAQELGILNSSGKEAVNAALGLGFGISDIPDRQKQRQEEYKNLVNKYLNDYGAGQYSDQFQERKALDQLYSAATGKGPTPGDLSRQAEAQQRGLNFARSAAGAGTAGVNPLLAARGISNAASQAFDNYEQQQGNDAAAERLALQRDVFRRMQGASNRDYAAGEALREAGYGEQRRLENIQTGAAQSYADSVRKKTERDVKQNQQDADSVLNMAGAYAKMIGTGAAAAVSDRREKKNIKDGKARIDIIFEKVKPKEFEYKDDPMHEKRMGVMAQDLEDAGLDYMVKESPEGVKHVLTNELATLLLGSQSRVFERLERLEDAILHAKKRGVK